jgi:hypothetical protein
LQGVLDGHGTASVGGSDLDLLGRDINGSVGSGDGTSVRHSGGREEKDEKYIEGSVLFCESGHGFGAVDWKRVVWWGTYVVIV